jgi:hypothetical protein
MTTAKLLEKMADLESRIAVIYERFVTQFRPALYVSDLWDSMSREELHHADLLSRAVGRAGGAPAAGALEQHVRALEAVVGRYEDEQARLVDLQEALAATADIEEAEAEHLHGVLAALGDAGRALATNPALQHKTHGLLARAIELYATPAVRQRIAWQRFHD